MRAALPAAFRPRPDRPAVVGHRGVRGSHPENTLGAFEEAARQGADAIELDVRTSLDGEVIVAHDPDLRRVAGDARSVAALTAAELRAIDVGGGEPPPTLREALRLARDAGVGVNVEIKYDVPSKLATVRAVAEVLSAWDPRHDVIVSCFDPWMLAAHRALVPGRRHAQIVHASTYHDWAIRVGRLLAFDGFHLEAVLADRARTSAITRGGYLGAWTVNDPAVARSLWSLGASALITDTPRAILDAFARG